MEMNRCPGCMEEIGGEKICPKCGYVQSSRPENSFALQPNTILHGRYLVGRVLGQGGFGISYIGWDLALNTKVAIKEYYPAGQVSRNVSVSNSLSFNHSQMTEEQWRTGCDSFLREARKMAKIRTVPAIVRVADFFVENNTAYIVMDFVEGVTLKAQLEKNGTMDCDSCVKLLMPLIEGLADIHKNNIIHRDISPDNIMLQPDGQVRLLDLGAAKDMDPDSMSMSMSAAVIKQGFSPMEQYSSGMRTGPWTDVYAMCATIYYCVTGRMVPNAPDRIDGDTLSFGTEFTKGQSEVLRHGLAVLKQDRIQTMDELAQRLKSSLNGGDGGYGKEDGKKKIKPLIIGGAAAAVLLIVLAASLAGGSKKDVPTPSPSPELLNSPEIQSPAAGEEEPSEPPASAEPSEPAVEYQTVEAMGTTNANAKQWSRFVKAWGYYCVSDINDTLYLINIDTSTGWPRLDGAMPSDFMAYDLNPAGRGLYLVVTPDFSSDSYVGYLDLAANGLYAEEVVSGRGDYSSLRYVRCTDGKQYLYYRAGMGMCLPLYRYDLETGEEEELLSGEKVSWYNIYDKYIYYISYDGDSYKDTRLKRAALNGEQAELLDDSHGYSGGFVEDGAMYLQSYVTGTLVTCDLDGKIQDSPLDDLDVLGMSALGYDDGWIYYMPFYQETEQLWRVRPDGSGQEMLTTWEGGGEMLSFAFGTDSCLGIVTGAGPVYVLDKDGGDRQQLWINK